LFFNLRNLLYVIAQGAVIVEKQDISLCSEAIKESTRITAWGKQVLGTVLLDVDLL